VAIRREPAPPKASNASAQKLPPAPALQLPHNGLPALEIEAQAGLPGRSWE
jgi:hypothetical protein